MKYVFAAIIVTASTFLSYAALNEWLARRLKIFALLSSDEETKKLSLSSTGITAATVVSALFATAVFYSAYRTGSVWEFLSYAVPVLFFAPCACYDFREHKIPNTFTILLAVYGMAVLAVDFWRNRNNLSLQSFLPLIAALAIVLVFYAASRIVKNGVGGGDIKLVGAAALAIGFNMLSNTLMIATVVCLFTAIVLLTAKKIDKKGSIPFGPFIYIGYCVSLILINY